MRVTLNLLPLYTNLVESEDQFYVMSFVYADGQAETWLGHDILLTKDFAVELSVGVHQVLVVNKEWKVRPALAFIWEYYQNRVKGLVVFPDDKPAVDRACQFYLEKRPHI